MGSDWARQLMAGMSSALGQYQAAIVEVVDCGFSADEQIRAFNRLSESQVDAVVSIPIGNQEVAEAHRRIHRAEKKLILLDNAPTGLSPGTDYVSVVSADNFGLGAIAAQLLFPHLPPDRPVGMLSFGVDFFATHEREIAFAKWMARNCPHLTVVQEKFLSLADVGAVSERMLEKYPQLSGLFVVWDEPAMIVVEILRHILLFHRGDHRRPWQCRCNQHGDGANIKGIAAQKPYDQGKDGGGGCIARTPRSRDAILGGAAWPCSHARKCHSILPVSLACAGTGCIVERSQQVMAHKLRSRCFTPHSRTHRCC
ncbi:MAG: substrate-binding domain-containing protein [Sphingomonadales bacterium]|nr:substrate-binding domain-containing protein [Sphingomonadales bacterium]